MMNTINFNMQKKSFTVGVGRFADMVKAFEILLCVRKLKNKALRIFKTNTEINRMFTGLNTILKLNNTVNSTLKGRRQSIPTSFGKKGFKKFKLNILAFRFVLIN
jgi:hypothetical protein